MCGIAGIYSDRELSETDLTFVHEANQIQIHRGPDDVGFYNARHCALGHRRLAIIDLSQDGHQPMSDRSERYWIVFNGEIYNYIELRSGLEKRGWQFKTKTDTEVLLTAYQQFGPDCLHLLNGMFAFAIYDAENRSLFLARDRFGIKPLYYLRQGGKLFFASESKALMGLPNIHKQVNPQALFDFFAFNRTDIFDETFVQAIKRVPKGHYAKVSGSQMQIQRWWSPLEFIGKGGVEQDRDAIDHIHDIFIDSVRLRMRSDVPVGSCLSGGLDSSILVGVLYAFGLADEAFQTFTASFNGHPLDETSYIDDLNRQYPFRNHRTYPTAQDALKQLDIFVYHNDEPTTNASFFSQYLVMGLAKKMGVTVLLDGQGGDENFAGYQYFHGFYMNGLLRSGQYAAFINEISKNILRKQDISAYQTLLYQLAPPRLQAVLIQKTVPFLKKTFFQEHIHNSRIFNEFFDSPDLNTSLARHFQYKLEHLLRMEDRNSMAFSLEARVPYLDFRFVEYLLGLKADLKIHAGETKRLQKAALGYYSTPTILNRTDKIGFGTPLDDWMNSTDWKNHTIDSVNYLCSHFPEIFTTDFLDKLTYTGYHRWKVNQLASWHQQFIAS
jgi:asparagine synthase (glutamine-hydrolysing)